MNCNTKKRLSIFSLIVFSLFLLPLVSADHWSTISPLKDNLLYSYPINEQTGTTINERLGNPSATLLVNDTLSGEWINDSYGFPSAMFIYDGFGYLMSGISNPSISKVALGTDAFTIVMEANMSKYLYDGGEGFVYGFYGGVATLFSLGDNLDITLDSALSIYDDGSPLILMNGNTYPLNNLNSFFGSDHTFAFVVDENLTIYIDGSYFQTLTDINKGDFRNVSAPVLNLGYRPDTGSYRMNGRMREVSVWNRSLSESEIVNWNNSIFSAEASPLPLITINSPVLNHIYSTNSIFLNFTTDINASCLYSLNDGNTNNTMTNVNNVHFTATNNSIADGDYVATAYCNNSNGLTIGTRAFSIHTTTPVVMIYHPQNITYTSLILPINLSVNYSAYNTANISACWLSDDLGATNHTLTDCLNTTYSANAGSHTLRIYANDSVGIQDFSQVTFQVTLFVAPPNVTNVTQQTNSFSILTSAGVGLGGFLNAIRNPLVAFVIILAMLGGIVLLVYAIAGYIKQFLINLRK